MNEKAIREDRILEAIEACRPGIDNLADRDFAHLATAIAADPGLEDLYERLQAVDARVAAAMHDVTVPEGLARRLTDHLAAAGARSLELAEAVESPASQRDALAQPRSVSRRWLVMAGGTLTAAAVLLVAALFGIMGTSETCDAVGVRQLAIEFFNAESPEPGYLLAEKPPPRDYPPSEAVLRIPSMRWRPVRGLLGQSGVAYDLPDGGAPATLYVVRRRVAGLPNLPPLRPGLTTAGCSVSTWQSDGLLYVLVVRGGPKSYQRYLDLPRGPVT